MSEKLEKKTLKQSTLFAEDFLAKTLVLPENELASMVSDLHSGLSLKESLMKCDPNGSLLKTCQAFSVQKMEQILQSSSNRWMNAGMVWHGEYLTAKISESPRDADECLLWQVLETCVADKYYLSAKACQGILRRAEKRGKKLPEILERALREQANHTA